MPKTETIFVCKDCGQDFPRWYGQCPTCGVWNSLIEDVRQPATPHQKRQIIKPLSGGNVPVAVNEIVSQTGERVPTGMKEMERVLGGGVVKGSVILVSGEPGIGKSTLLLQLSNALSKNHRVLYASGEESIEQIKMRAQRLEAGSKQLFLLNETNLFTIEKAVEEIKPGYLVIDSIQTTYREDTPSSAGSMAQVRECAGYLVQLAKTRGLTVFIIGHVTKDGAIAGPRILEHMVDVVLYFEGERHKQYRLLRSHKNRFGSTHEIGVFEMKEDGLAEVSNPSQIFLAERALDTAGSIVTAAMEGSRPLLVEVQALVAPTKMAYPVRKASGVDLNRLSMVLAVLERQCGAKLFTQDVYVNVAGGVKVYEPALDLPMALAILSSLKNKPLPNKLAAVGEIGLSGEIRSVSHIERRIKEAENLSFSEILVPKTNLKQVKKSAIKITGISSVREAVNNIM